MIVDRDRRSIFHIEKEEIAATKKINGQSDRSIKSLPLYSKDAAILKRTEQIVCGFYTSTFFYGLQNTITGIPLTKDIFKVNERKQILGYF